MSSLLMSEKDSVGNLTRTEGQMPDFFIVGAMKAGTTSMHHYLRQVPGIRMSTSKEPYYFSRNIHFVPPFPDIIVRKKDDYLKLFEGVGRVEARGDASPGYLWDPETPYLIKKHVPLARIIIILRNPVERAFSHWFNRYRSGFEKRGFSEAVDELLKEKPPEESDGRQYVDFGFYSKQVMRYFQTFSSEKVKVLIFEEFIQNPGAAVKEVLKFLGLNPEGAESVKYEAYNTALSRQPPRDIRGIYAKKLLRSGSIGIVARKVIPTSFRGALAKRILYRERKNPKLSNVDRELLIKVYSEDVRKLVQLLKRPLPWNEFQDSLS